MLNCPKKLWRKGEGKLVLILCWKIMNLYMSCFFSMAIYICLFLWTRNLILCVQVLETLVNMDFMIPFLVNNMMLSCPWLSIISSFLVSPPQRGTSKKLFMNKVQWSTILIWNTFNRLRVRVITVTKINGETTITFVPYEVIGGITLLYLFFFSHGLVCHICSTEQYS